MNSSHCLFQIDEYLRHLVKCEVVIRVTENWVLKIAFSAPKPNTWSIKLLSLIRQYQLIYAGRWNLFF